MHGSSFSLGLAALFVEADLVRSGAEGTGLAAILSAMAALVTATLVRSRQKNTDEPAEVASVPESAEENSKQPGP